MNEKNNQQSNKKEHSIKSRDAINRVSTESDTDLKNTSLKEWVEGWSDTKEVSLRQGELNSVQERDHLGGGGTTKQSQTENNIATQYHTEPYAVKVTNVSKTFKIPHAKIDSMRSIFVNIYKKRTYEKFNALDNISFEVKKGEFLGIIGHNGAGKSTLLKILAGVYVPSEGNVEVNGMIAPFLELGIGFNPELSGRDNVYLNATVLGLTKEQIDEKFDRMVEFAELERFIDEQLKNYSSGMRARLAFSVSIHADRGILLMDEVLAVGDSRFTEKCLDVFKGYKNQGKTVILVTHSMDTVREYCDRALLLDSGKILDSGDVDEVCDKYIYRNVLEDKRKELEKKEKLEKEQKEQNKQIEESKKEVKKAVNITEVKLSDVNNNELVQIKYGDDFFVQIVVNINKIASNLNVSIQVFDNNTDQMVCDNNTFASKFNCSWQVGKNIFEIKFKDVMFNQGEIYFKAFLYKKGQGVVEMFCTKEKNNKIVRVVRQVGAGGGIMRIEHEWNRK